MNKRYEAFRVITTVCALTRTEVQATDSPASEAENKETLNSGHFVFIGVCVCACQCMHVCRCGMLISYYWVTL